MNPSKCIFFFNDTQLNVIDVDESYPDKKVLHSVSFKKIREAALGDAQTHQQESFYTASNLLSMPI